MHRPVQPMRYASRSVGCLAPRVDTRAAAGDPAAARRTVSWGRFETAPGPERLREPARDEVKDATAQTVSLVRVHRADHLLNGGLLSHALAPDSIFPRRCCPPGRRMAADGKRRIVAIGAG